MKAGCIDTLKYNAAIRKGVQWLRPLLSEDGSYKAHVATLEAYYKSPMAFAKVGNIADGQRVLQWIVHTYLTKDGHFQDSSAYPFSQRYCDLYRDLWLVWGAHHLNQSDVVQRCFNFVLRYYDSSCGGFQSSIATKHLDAMFDLRSTAFGGLVSLYTKNTEVALKAGNFVIEMLNLQPDLSKGFYLVRDAGGNLITNFSRKIERFFIVSQSQKQPLFYALGFAISFLTKLYHVTHKTEYWAAAETYLRICETFGQRIFQHHYSGKIGWGLAMMHNLTENPQYVELTVSVADYLVSMQLPTGEWYLSSLFSKPRKQPIGLTIDRTAEYIVWLTYIVHELNRRKNSTNKQSKSLT